MRKTPHTAGWYSPEFVAFMVVLAAAGLLMGGCGETPKQAENKARISKSIDDNAIMRRVREQVRHGLRNPEAAVFSGERATDFNGMTAACGYVSAPNGFGAMSGRQRYIGSGSGVVLFEEDLGSETMGDLWTQFGCSR